MSLLLPRDAAEEVARKEGVSMTQSVATAAAEKLAAEAVPAQRPAAGAAAAPTIAAPDAWRLLGHLR